MTLSDQVVKERHMISTRAHTHRHTHTHGHRANVRMRRASHQGRHTRAQTELQTPGHTPRDGACRRPHAHTRRVTAGQRHMATRVP